MRVSDLIEEVITLKEKLRCEVRSHRAALKRLEKMRAELNLFKSEVTENKIITHDPRIIDIRIMEHELYTKGNEMDDETYQTIFGQMMILTRELLDLKPNEHVKSELN